MKTAPGSPKTKENILGREKELSGLWSLLDKGSVVFTAVRRVGKSTILQKMSESPPDGCAVIKCDVEAGRHPSELVSKIFHQAKEHAVLSKKAKWLANFNQAYEKVAGTEVPGFVLPPVQLNWKSLLTLLIKDIAEHSENRVIILLDEFPQMIGNLIDEKEPALAGELLNTLRELRMEYQATGRFRLLIAGSIGLHLVVDELKQCHGYKGSPTNDMQPATLGGMSGDDVSLLCAKYLQEEGISRENPKRFDAHMRRVTDGIPLYVERICDAFQAAGGTAVRISDIDRRLLELINDPAVDWFWDVAKRLDTHCSRLQASGIAAAVLALLCRQRRRISETEIIQFVRSRVTVQGDGDIQRVLEMLRRDQYINRAAVGGIRRYGFFYEIMRRWWRLNKG